MPRFFSAPSYRIRDVPDTAIACRHRGRNRLVDPASPEDSASSGRSSPAGCRCRIQLRFRPAGRHVTRPGERLLPSRRATTTSRRRAVERRPRQGAVRRPSPGRGYRKCQPRWNGYGHAPLSRRSIEGRVALVAGRPADPRLPGSWPRVGCDLTDPAAQPQPWRSRSRGAPSAEGDDRSLPFPTRGRRCPAPASVRPTPTRAAPPTRRRAAPCGQEDHGRSRVRPVDAVQRRLGDDVALPCREPALSSVRTPGHVRVGARTTFPFAQARGEVIGGAPRRPRPCGPPVIRRCRRPDAVPARGPRPPRLPRGRPRRALPCVRYVLGPLSCGWCARFLATRPNRIRLVPRLPGTRPGIRVP